MQSSSSISTDIISKLLVGLQKGILAAKVLLGHAYWHRNWICHDISRAMEMEPQMVWIKYMLYVRLHMEKHTIISEKVPQSLLGGTMVRTATTAIGMLNSCSMLVIATLPNPGGLASASIFGPFIYRRFLASAPVRPATKTKSNLIGIGWIGGKSLVGRTQ